MSDSVKQYLKLKITSDEIDLNTIKNTCEITNSEVAKNVEIDNNGIDPTKWSRDQLIKQFNLLTIYPWFWKQFLKSKANSATLQKPIVMVQIGTTQGGLNIPISDLKHFC